MFIVVIFLYLIVKPCLFDSGIRNVALEAEFFNMFHGRKIGLRLSTLPSIHCRKCHSYFFVKAALGQKSPLPDSLDFFQKTHVASPLHPYTNNIVFIISHQYKFSKREYRRAVSPIASKRLKKANKRKRNRKSIMRLPVFILYYAGFIICFRKHFNSRRRRTYLYFLLAFFTSSRAHL